jgi:hypothetical protein
MRQAFRRSEELLDLELWTGEIMQEEQKGENRSNNLQQQPQQMVVAIERTEELIAQGWRLVATLPKDKAVVEKNGVRMEPVWVHKEGGPGGI